MDLTDSTRCPGLLNEDEISNANTEDSLLCSRNSSETISSLNRDDTQCCHLEKKKNTRGAYCTLSLGILLTLSGILSIVWTPFWVLMHERLRMMPGLPPYEWWKNPPDEVLLRVYLFNVTNPEEFLNGTDAKLKMREIGPIIYREKLVHKNVVFNDNGTLSYVAKRSAIYLDEQNTIDLNATLVLPNLAVLGMASYLWDASFFTKFGFNMLLRSVKSEPIVRATIGDYLWNFTDPILDVAQKIAPSLVPVKNMGILARIYGNFEDNVTVYIGPRYGHDNFFLIDKYDGSEFLPGRADCAESLKGSTEGVAYPQFLSKSTVLRYWRKTLCKVTPLYYDSEAVKYGVVAYKFALPNDTYDRTGTETSDCHRGDPILVDGLSDVSKCYYDFPMAASFPHFLYGDAGLRDHVDGLEPDPEKHDSFVIVEPITGIPMESRARSQSNLVMRKLSGFNQKVERFGDTIVPMFWAEYNQVGLPWYIAALVFFMVAVVRPLQRFFSVLLIAAGVVLCYVAVERIRNRRKRGHLLLMNKTIQFEREVFLNDKC